MSATTGTVKPWIRHYDPGVPETLEPYPAVPLHRSLEESARRFPDRPATLFKAHARFAAGRLTYRELNELADRFAAALRSMGVKKGDRVLLFLPNMPQFLIAFYGTLKLGAVVTAANPQYTATELAYQLRDSGAETVVALSRFYPTLLEALRQGTAVKNVLVTNIKEYMTPVLRLLFTLTRERKDGHRVTLEPGHRWLAEALASQPAGAPPAADVGPEDVALLQYSGGTTGVPKAVVALHRNLVANTLQISSWLQGTEQGTGTVLLAIPLYHVYGMVAGMTFGVQAAATLILIPDARDVPVVLAAISAHRPTVFPGVPRLYNAINNYPDVGRYDLKSIRACISGSAPLLLEIKTRFEELTGGKLCEGYGLSEAPTATHCNPIEGENRSGSIGLPFPDVDCRIVDVETGADVPQGEVGELALRGPMVMAGYWNQPEETATALKEGWLFTGDVARMDAEGYFYIVDRKKEVIKASGFQVWPRDVEEVLVQHPQVLECAVAGINDPSRGGETVKAWVVLKPGGQATETELRDFCRKQLAPFKVPHYIEFRSELPKTTVGKVLRRVLVEEERRKTQA